MILSIYILFNYGTKMNKIDKKVLSNVEYSLKV